MYNQMVSKTLLSVVELINSFAKFYKSTQNRHCCSRSTSKILFILQVSVVTETNVHINII